jgi:hypothetical protein
VSETTTSSSLDVANIAVVREAVPAQGDRERDIEEDLARIVHGLQLAPPGECR